jgi:hypothetical protein
MEGWNMSARLIQCLLFAVMVLTTVPTKADWLCDFFQSFPQDTKRRNCWPQPFTAPDRQAVRVPLAIQVGNGWRRQNLLSDYHFEANTGELSEAGRLKVKWIAFEAPSQHRDIFVRAAESNDETSARMNAVHTYLSKLMPQGVLPTVSETRISDDGWPADQVDRISRKLQSTTPTPRLPSSSGGSSGSGGGTQ